jgi:hypothetical protein
MHTPNGMAQQSNNKVQTIINHSITKLIDQSLNHSITQSLNAAQVEAVKGQKLMPAIHSSAAVQHTCALPGLGGHMH